MDNKTEAAMNVVRGEERPENVGLGQWVWETLMGDFKQDRTAGQIGTDMVISLVPFVGTATSLRDLVANILNYFKNPKDKLILLFIAITLISFVPEGGPIAKGVFKIIFVYLRKYAKDAADLTNTAKLVPIVNRAVDAALPQIVKFLQDSRVIQWATNNKVANLLGHAATGLRFLADKINGAKLKAAFNQAMDTLIGLLKKIYHLVPASTATKIEDFLEQINKVRKEIADSLEDTVKPLRIILKTAAKRLDDYALVTECRMVNKGWIAPMSEEGTALLVKAHPPEWAKLGRMGHPPYESGEAEAVAAQLKNAGKNYPYPRLPADKIATFERKTMETHPIEGPKKLYRIVDPSSSGGGMFWVDEATFKELTSRAVWREKLAVPPNWNQNGQYVVYEIPAGETLYTWKGKAASQPIRGTPYHLEGGGDQIVFYPEADTMKTGRPRVDPRTGEDVLIKDRVDTSIETKDITGKPVTMNVREKINDAHIKGPYSTHWGMTDWTPEEAKRLLIYLPDTFDSNNKSRK